MLSWQRTSTTHLSQIKFTVSIQLVKRWRLAKLKRGLRTPRRQIRHLSWLPRIEQSPAANSAHFQLARPQLWAARTLLPKQKARRAGYI